MKPAHRWSCSSYLCVSSLSDCELPCGKPRAHNTRSVTTESKGVCIRTYKTMFGILHLAFLIRPWWSTQSLFRETKLVNCISKLYTVNKILFSIIQLGKSKTFCNECFKYDFISKNQQKYSLLIAQTLRYSLSVYNNFIFINPPNE